MKSTYIFNFIFLLSISCDNSASSKLIQKIELLKLDENKLYEFNTLIDLIEKNKSEYIVCITNKQDSSLIYLSELSVFQSINMPVEISVSNLNNEILLRKKIVVYNQMDVDYKSIKYLFSIELDTSCFTQGLAKINDFLYFSCGLYNQSKLNIFSLKRKNYINSISIEDKYFAEGCDFYNDSLFVLTYKENQVLLFTSKLEFIDSLELPSQISEGWGIFSRYPYLYISNGSSKLYECIISSKSLSINRVITIHMNGHPINNINEMSLINDSLFAFNRWYDSNIYIGNIYNGQIVKVLNVKKYVDIHKEQGVLNGIHIDKDTLYFTGKNWSKLYVSLLDD